MGLRPARRDGDQKGKLLEFGARTRINSDSLPTLKQDEIKDDDSEIIAQERIGESRVGRCEFSHLPARPAMDNLPVNASLYNIHIHMYLSSPADALTSCVCCNKPAMIKQR
jgi:hypothetical protein